MDSVVPGGQAQLLGLRASMWLYSHDDVILDSPYLVYQFFFIYFPDGKCTCSVEIRTLNVLAWPQDLGQIVDQMKRVKGPLIRLGVVCSSALDIKPSHFKALVIYLFARASSL